MAEQVRAGELDLAFVGLFADQVPDDLVHRAARRRAAGRRRRRAATRWRPPAVGLAELADGAAFVEMRAESGLRAAGRRRLRPRRRDPADRLRARHLRRGGPLRRARLRPGRRAAVGRRGTPDDVVARPSPTPRPGTRSASCTAAPSPPRRAPAPSSRCWLPRHPEPEVRRVRDGRQADPFQPHVGAARMVEEPHAVAEHAPARRGSDLVELAGLQALLRDRRAEDVHVLLAGRRAGRGHGGRRGRRRR